MENAMEKVCSRCGETRPLADYRFDNVARGLRKSACRECENKRMREDRAKHLEKRRAGDRRRYRARPHHQHRTTLVRRYGLTEDQADAAISTKACDLCGRDNGTRRLNVDHCHTTGRNRGLLCDKCNLALGHLADHPELIRKVADYVEAGGSGRF
jgi:hypothetical protein